MDCKSPWNQVPVSVSSVRVSNRKILPFLQFSLRLRKKVQKSTMYKNQWKEINVRLRIQIQISFRVCCPLGFWINLTFIGSPSNPLNTVNTKRWSVCLPLSLYPDPGLLSHSVHTNCFLGTSCCFSYLKRRREPVGPYYAFHTLRLSHSILELDFIILSLHMEKFRLKKAHSW